ncbi:MAG: hypothetical protein ACOWYE_01990 [Desulfatiglandales bacterium]
MKNPAEMPQRAHRLSTTLAAALFSLSAVVLLLYVSVVTIFHFRTQKAAVFSRQQLIAQEAAKTINHFINESFSILETTSWMTDLDAMPELEQTRILQSLLGLRPAFRGLALLNADDRILTLASRLSMGRPGNSRTV